MRIFLSCGVMVWVASFAAAVAGQNTKHPIQAALDAGQFDVAQRLLPQSPAEADSWLGKIALAQLEGGQPEAAKQSLRQIQSNEGLVQATQSVAQFAQGGGTGADFDSLINLITSTVEPDSWDLVGGPGTVLSFPGGVAVDAQGVISKKRTKRNARSLDVVREASMKRFAHGDARRSAKLRMVSLPRLERELMIRLAMGESPTDAMTHLAGLFEIRYVFVYPETNDVVIAGPAGAWSNDENGRAVTDHGRPTLLLDDLATLLRNSREQHGKFGCSIDPKQESLAATKAFLERPTGPLKPRQTKRWVNRIRETLGLQDIRVYGIDARTHAARVLVEADYHMKLVGMGLEPSVDGLQSYLDSIDTNSIPKSMDVLRWWFTLRPEAIAGNAEGSAFEFASQAVRLQCANERLTVEGQRSNTQGSSELNQVFANEFTQRFAQLCREYPLYSELDNLFRMALVAGILQTSDVQSKVDWNGDWLTKAIKPALGSQPLEVASIVNHRVIDQRHVIVGVSGGVSVNVASYVQELSNSKDTAELQSTRSVANKKVPTSSDTWWWD